MRIMCARAQIQPIKWRTEKIQLCGGKKSGEKTCFSCNEREKNHFECMSLKVAEREMWTSSHTKCGTIFYSVCLCWSATPHFSFPIIWFGDLVTQFFILLCDLNLFQFECFFLSCFVGAFFFSHLYAWKKRGIGFSYFPALFVCKELKFSSILDVTRTQLHLSKQFFVDWTYLFTGKRQRWNTDFLQFFCCVECCGEKFFF